ncbi:winged helix-turn-helix domain-containing protein [Ileibacterium valens]|uniref:winged helix-turn-helix domain-containing protein n=1 Tax=Ileibacterium valens TaxID=1862668 RepID=UPI0024B9654B|nr:winged helix-turn-helix domain-containing protein [Ileibacterium valens]
MNQNLENAIVLQDGLFYDPDLEEIVFNEKKLPLTFSQQKVVRTLLDQKGAVVNRKALMQELWQTDTYISEGSLTTCVSRLRSRLKNVGMPDPIRTKKGIGYYIP